MLTQLKQEIWTEIIENIAKNSKTTMSDIFRQTHYTPSHIIDTIKLLEKHKFITRKEVGRTMEITITKKGIEIAEYTTIIRGLLK